MVTLVTTTAPMLSQLIHDGDGVPSVESVDDRSQITNMDFPVSVTKPQITFPDNPSPVSVASPVSPTLSQLPLSTSTTTQITYMDFPVSVSKPQITFPDDLSPVASTTPSQLPTSSTLTKDLKYQGF